jgi:hypothetical protein
MTRKSLFRWIVVTGVAGFVPACGTSHGGSAPQPIASTITINSIIATPAAVVPGGNVVLTAAAADSASGTLSYTWTTSSGILSTPDSNPVTWTAPLTLGSVLIHLTVTSTSGSSAAGVASVIVSNNPNGTSITLNSITASPLPVAPGGQASVTAAVTYTGGGTLTFGWSTSGGLFSAPTGNPVTWTAPLAEGNYAVNLTVTDGLGASASGWLSILVVMNWPSTPSNVPICTSGGHQDNPQIISDGAGGAIIAWTDPRAGSNNHDIYVQRVNNAGVVQWTSDGVALCTAADVQWNPQLTSDGQGGAIVVWYDRRNGTHLDLYAQRVNGSGTVQWTTNGVAICTALGDQDAPKLLPDGLGGAMIVWQDQRDGGYKVYGQRVNNAGSIQWTADGMAICTAAGGQGGPEILSDGSGGAIIVWGDGRNGNVDIYAQRVNGSGAAQWTIDGVAISTAIEAQAYFQTVADGLGGAIIVWQDQRNLSNDIYAQRVSAGGVVQWSTDGIAISTQTGYQEVPHVVSDGSGGAIIVWQDKRSGTNTDLYSQRISGAGAFLWAIDGVPVSTAANVLPYSQIVSDGVGGALIAWRDNRNGNYDIFAHRLNEAGTPQWSVNGVPICTASNDQGVPQVVSDGLGGAIVVWTDFRSATSYDIYAQRVNASGLK